MNIGLYHPKAGTRNAGGKAVYVQEMARRLARNGTAYVYTEDGPLTATLRDSEATVVPIPPIRNGAVEAAIRRLTPFRGRDVPTLLTFAGGIASGDVRGIDDEADVVLTHHYLDDLLVSNAVDVPVVYQYHAVQSAGLGARTRERFTDASAHLANSRRTADEVADAFGREVDEVVTPGVDRDRFSPAATPAFDREEPTVLFVGRVVEEKGVFDLVDAVARLGDARLVVVGRGDLAAVRRRATARGIADAVTVEGVVDHGDLPGYYVAADVVCSPSHYESFGMVNLEAMACGTPVVTTAIPGIVEYAVDGENARLVDPGDVDGLAAALRSLLADPDLRRDLGAAGRATAADHSWDRQAERLAAFCRDLIDP